MRPWMLEIRPVTGAAFLLAAGCGRSVPPPRPNPECRNGGLSAVFFEGDIREKGRSMNSRSTTSPAHQEMERGRCELCLYQSCDSVKILPRVSDPAENRHVSS